jgi:hypothetical protein
MEQQIQQPNNGQTVNPTNNWNKLFNKIYYLTFILGFIIILIFRLYWEFKASPTYINSLIQPYHNNIFIIIEIIIQSLRITILIPIIFLIIAIILKLFKKLDHFSFIPLVLTIIIGLMITSAANWIVTPIAKPVIYLYPQEKENINVKLKYEGEIIADYPKYDKSTNGWSVVAFPDGHLINQADNQEYSYLFWEGRPDKPINWDLSEGYVVKGENTREFLQKILPKIGLTPKEYNEFIVYWYPLMKDNPYNLIHFADEQYTKTAPLNISPKPDSILRVFMVFKPLANKIEIKPQIIQPFERKGFTVVEWGGTEIK